MPYRGLGLLYFATVDSGPGSGSVHAHFTGRPTEGVMGGGNVAHNRAPVRDPLSEKKLAEQRNNKIRDFEQSL